MNIRITLIRMSDSTQLISRGLPYTFLNQVRTNRVEREKRDSGVGMFSFSLIQTAALSSGSR
jgi:hypothetical protein